MPIQSLQLPPASGLLRNHVVEPGALKAGELTYSVELADTRLPGSGIDIDIGVGAKPMPLLMSSLLENIHQQLRSRSVNVTSIKRADEPLQDNPDAVAKSITKQIEGLYTGFQQQHPQLDELSARGQFNRLVADGLESGLAETRSILSGVGALQAGVAARIERTYDLVQQGFLRS